MDHKKTAIDKLENEYKNFKGNRYEAAMKEAVYNALRSFCEQDGEFAQCIAESENKDFEGCMKCVAKGVRDSISDLAAYKRAVEYYFAGADIECTMRITKAGDLPAAESKPASMSLSFDDLF